MKVRGVIAIKPRIRVMGDECHGVTIAEGDKFEIRISKSAFNDPFLYAETLLHELIHLWLFVLSGTNEAWSVSALRHHKIIDRTVPLAIRLLKSFLRRKHNDKIRVLSKRHKYRNLLKQTAND